MDKEEIEFILKNVGFSCGRLEGYEGKVFKGGCGEHVSVFDSYRCADCTASFHRDCIRKHFLNEKNHEKI